ncbi:hypothetical protein N7475_002560 [Penicillium sp. IBT 31633x]|nr:hypothetical protein N7475_002560 [Penicillium sp. IBT 31633x]
MEIAIPSSIAQGSSELMGAGAVWVGTRFVTARESAAPKLDKMAIIDAGSDDTIRSTLWTDRPNRSLATPYIRDRERNRRSALGSLESKGLIV